MGFAVGMLAFAVILAIVTFAVLAAIAAVVEILPPFGNPDSDDRNTETSASAVVQPHPRLNTWPARRPPTHFDH
jgi:hypothetical protein